MYRNNRYLLDGTLLSDQEKKEYEQVTKNMGDAECSFCLLYTSINTYYAEYKKN